MSRVDKDTKNSEHRKLTCFGYKIQNKKIGATATAVRAAMKQKNMAISGVRFVENYLRKLTLCRRCETLFLGRRTVFPWNLFPFPAQRPFPVQGFLLFS